MEGLLRTADAFAALHDEEVVTRALMLADRLASQQFFGDEQERVREAAARIRARLAEPKTAPTDRL